MLLLILLLISVLCVPTDANLCFKDSNLNDVQQYSYKLPHSPLSNYWNKQRIRDNKPLVKEHEPTKFNFNLAFHVFGRFSGNTDNTVIKAGYYGEDDALIYSVEVFCGTKNWISYAPTNKTEIIEGIVRPEPYQEGELEKGCNDGEDFDLIFKVKQPHQFTWMFNAESLQKGYQETYWKRVAHGKQELVKRNRTLNVPSHDPSKSGGASKAKKFTVEITGAGVMTRFAFGRCMTWPRNMPCDKAASWLDERSKLPVVHGPLGLHRGIYKLDCMPQAPSLFRATQFLHPDEFSKWKSAWVCCVNMKTGLIWEDDKANNCRESSDWVTAGSPFFCNAAVDVDLVDEETRKYQASQSDQA